MTATTKAAIVPFSQAVIEFDSNPMHFLNEDLACVPVSGIAEEFRKLPRYLPVIVLVPKSAVHDRTTRKKAGTQQVRHRCLLTAGCGEGLVEKSQHHRRV
jgi:hypothetical protein